MEENTNFLLVDEEGVEPSPLARHGSEPCAYANSATRPIFQILYYLIVS